MTAEPMVCFRPEADLQPRPEQISFSFSEGVCFRPEADVPVVQF